MATEVERHGAQPPSDAVHAKGLYRVQIEEDGEITGDSGWHENQIQNLGFNLYIVSSVGAIGGSLQVGYAALGTGTLPNVSDTSLNGEITGATKRQAISGATSSTSKTLHFAGTFASTNSFLTASSNIQNIGLFNSSATGTLFAGNTYASSSCATNQNVNFTYDITWS